MSTKKDRYLITGALIALLLAALLGCVASRGDESSGGEANALTPPTESPGPFEKPLEFTVTSVKGTTVEGSNCVVAQVMVTNNRSTSIQGVHRSFPAPFRLVNDLGQEIRAVKKRLSLDGSVPPGEEGPGSITFCAAGITRGGKVTLHHGGRTWKAAVPKPKPKPKRTVEAPRVPPRSSGGGSGGGGGGAYPGYTGPRCYEPGGKVWHPC